MVARYAFFFNSVGMLIAQEIEKEFEKTYRLKEGSLGRYVGKYYQVKKKETVLIVKGKEKAYIAFSEFEVAQATHNLAVEIANRVLNEERDRIIKEFQDGC